MKDLASRRLTYDLVGATLNSGWSVATPPTGFRVFERTVRIGDGLHAFSDAAEALMRWQVKTRSGFEVRAENDRRGTETPDLTLGRVWLLPHVGPLRIIEPVEVVAVIDEPDRKGYAYGTLEGHPVCGEEAFIVSRREDGSVWFTIRSLTGMSRGKWRLLYPGILIGQRIYRGRYLRSLQTV